MSIGVFAGGEGSLSEQEAAASAKEKAPRKRQTVAKVDVVAPPEAR